MYPKKSRGVRLAHDYESPQLTPPSHSRIHLEVNYYGIYKTAARIHTNGGAMVFARFEPLLKLEERRQAAQTLPTFPTQVAGFPDEFVLEFPVLASGHCVPIVS
jgi:hypothetical protein